MSLISDVLESRAKTSITEPWQWPSLQGFLTANQVTSSGVAMDEWKSLQLSVVYACVRLISNTIAMLPLSLHQEVEEGKSRIASENPLNNVLYRVANPELTAYTFKQVMMASILLWGNGYAEITRNGRGQVIALAPLMPSKMKVEMVNGIRFYTYTRPDGIDVKLTNKEVFHLPGLSFDGLMGISPIAMMRNELGLSMSLQEFGAKYFANGTNLGGILQHPGKLSERAGINLKKDLQENFTGVSKAVKIMVLEEGMTYNKIAIPAEDAQFIESRKFELEEIARYFGVQLHMIQNLDKATNNNIEQQSIEFRTYALMPWEVTWEQEIFRSLLTPKEQTQKYYAKFNMNALMRGDYKTRMEGYRTGVQMGLYSLNEVRKLEDMNAIPKEEGGDIHWVNSAMIPIDKQMEGPQTAVMTAVITDEGDAEDENDESTTANGTADT